MDGVEEDEDAATIPPPPPPNPGEDKGKVEEEEEEPAEPKSGASESKHMTSIAVRPFFFIQITTRSSQIATLQITASVLVSSRMNFPVGRSHNLTAPSFPPVTILLESKQRLVTDRSWAWTRY